MFPGKLEAKFRVPVLSLGFDVQDEIEYLANLTGEPN
jgi:hypothetical protein